MPDKDLAWAYLPLPVQKRVAQGQRSRLSYIKLGESFAQRGLRYSDVLRYMKLNSDTLDQDARDAIDAGYRGATGWVDLPKITKPVVKPKKKPGRKKLPPWKKRKKRKYKAKRGPETFLARFLASARQGGRVSFPKTEKPPGEAAVLKSLLKESGVPISLRELKARYPAYIPQTSGARRLVPVIIDRELILYTLAKAIEPGLKSRYHLQQVVRRLLKDRISPPRQRRLAILAEKKRLAILANPTDHEGEGESDGSPDMPIHI